MGERLGRVVRGHAAGNGDAINTVAQKIPISGVIVVSTPNELSLIDARRAVDMYTKVDAKILGRGEYELF